jgi:hypothetical protein
VADPHRLEFDGVDDIATIPGGSIPELQAPSQASVEVWFRTGIDVNDRQYVLEILETYADPYAGFKLAVANGQVQHWIGNSWKSAAPVEPDTWYHAVITKDVSDSVRVYLDGQQVDVDGSVNLGSQNSEVVLGAGTFSGPGVYDRFFQGSIAQMCLWQCRRRHSELRSRPRSLRGPRPTERDHTGGGGSFRGRLRQLLHRGRRVAAEPVDSPPRCQRQLLAEQ